MVGDRGMITSARIEALKELDGDYAWITALRAPAIKKLMADDGPLQLRLFDEQDLAEITSPEFPGERLIACRNPALAEERARKREALLAATEKLLAPVIARVAAGKLTGEPRSAGRSARSSASTRWPSTSSHHHRDSLPSSASRRRSTTSPARRDLRHPHPAPAAELGAAGTVTAYKNLKYVERDFRHIKSDDLDLRPVFHRLEKRVKGHVLICMLAAYLTWHLRQAWAPLTYTDEEPPEPASPVAPATLGIRRRQGLTPARRGRPPLPQLPGPARPPGHPHPQRAPLRRHPATVPVLTDPTSQQQQAFALIGAAIPLTLKK